MWEFITTLIDLIENIIEIIKIPLYIGFGFWLRNVAGKQVKIEREGMNNGKESKTE